MVTCQFVFFPILSRLFFYFISSDDRWVTHRVNWMIQQSGISLNRQNLSLTSFRTPIESLFFKCVNTPSLCFVLFVLFFVVVLRKNNFDTRRTPFFRDYFVCFWRRESICLNDRN
jgi:hypothetical protein